MIFRDLLRSEIEKLREIDRSELIEKIYYHKKGKLVLENEFYDMKGFPPGELEALITRQYAIYDQGGCIFGAFDENKLVGIASIENKFIGVMKKTLKMDILFVSHAYRGQKIAVSLVEMARKKAIDLCAEKIYISATPSEHTVNFYMRCGAILTTELDEALFEMEPEDIHLELNVEKIIYKYSKTLEESDVLALYQDAKWSSYTNDVPKLMQAISNSLMVITAWECEQLVGLIRVIGDGSVILYIQDILVLTEYKRKGIGTKLLKLILEEFKTVRQKVLLTQDSAETRYFYESLGFKSCDDGVSVAFAIQG